MNNMKYEILLHVHAATTLNPARCSDFQKDTAHIVEYKICIKELISAGYLSETIGSDVLSITTKGVEAVEAEQDNRRYRKCEIIRYCITTAIAVIALFISIIALVV